MVSQRFTGGAAALRNAAHRVSDVIYEKILGVRGAFATRIAYVSVDGQPPTQTLPARSLRMPTARIPGSILESRSPSCRRRGRPDGQWLAYVSFESKRSAVFVQWVRTGEREGVGARGHQRSTGLVAGRQEARADVGGQRR